MDASSSRRACQQLGQAHQDCRPPTVKRDHPSRHGPGRDGGSCADPAADLDPAKRLLDPLTQALADRVAAHAGSCGRRWPTAARRPDVLCATCGVTPRWPAAGRCARPRHTALSAPSVARRPRVAASRSWPRPPPAPPAPLRAWCARPRSARCRFSISRCPMKHSREGWPSALRYSLASGSVVEACVSLLRFSPRKFRSALRPGPPRAVHPGTVLAPEALHRRPRHQSACRPQKNARSTAAASRSGRP